MGVVRRLSEDQVSVLSGLQLLDLRPQRDGTWLLLPNDRVGVARCGDLEIQVRPKIGIDRLLFLLGYARDPGFRPEDVMGADERDLWPALACSLARQAERALVRGVLQGYVTAEEALPLIRGSIRIADQIARRPGVMVPIEIRYDDYTADTTENHILRTAIRRMQAVPRVAPAVQSRLAHLDACLQTVRIVPNGAPVPPWRLTRLNAHYAPALRLADLVLRYHSTEPGPGGLDIASFVVRMPAVFEEFVTTALREALARYPGHTRVQHEVALDEQGELTIRPDIVHLVGPRAAAIFDAKYKLLSTIRHHGNADTYQMLTYCTVLDVATGWLVYAQGDKGTTGSHRIRNTSIDVIHYPLDLMTTPGALLDQISTLAAKAMTSAVAQPSSRADDT